MTTAEFREDMYRTMTEAQWQEWVISEAHLHHWRVAHFRPVRIQRANGSTYYETPVAADGKGYPDLVLAKHRILFVELKRENGVLDPAQKEWEKAVRTGKGEWFTWRPSDRENISRILGGVS